MVEQRGCTDGAPEGREVQYNVVDRCDEPTIEDMSHRDHQPARERH
jgi:hypothetical protein